MLKYILIGCIFLSPGCQKKNDFVYDVPREFEPHVRQFIAEAAARGQQISIANLIIRYELSPTVMFCATSNVISTGNEVQKIISIKSTTCWQNETQLETIIFHELGHCILGRDHENSLMPKGDPQSIMFLDNSELYSPCTNTTGSSCDLLYRRAYYIDELFNPATPLPDWGK